MTPTIRLKLGTMRPADERVTIAEHGEVFFVHVDVNGVVVSRHVL